MNPAHDILTGPDVQVRVGRGRDAIPLLDERWDELVRKQTIPNPTLTSAWLREMATLLKGTPLVIVVESKRVLLAGGAFSLFAKGGRHGFRMATWLGGNGRPVILPDLLVAPDAGPFGGLIFETLLRKEAHAVWLGPTPSDGPAAKSLRQVAPWLLFRPGIEGWIVNLPPPRIENLRQKCDYRLRRAQRHGASIEIRLHEDPESISPALERLFQLHRERWTGRNDVSLFSETEACRAWHRRAIAPMVSRGAVRIIELMENGELVAAILGLLAGRGAIFHTPATRIGGILRGPGHVAMLAWVDAAMKAGAEVMQLGRGSGEPEGPKGSLGPTMVDCGFLLAGRTHTIHRLLATALWLRKKASLLRKKLRMKPRAGYEAAMEPNEPGGT